MSVNRAIRMLNSEGVAALPPPEHRSVTVRNLLARLEYVETSMRIEKRVVEGYAKRNQELLNKLNLLRRECDRLEEDKETVWCAALGHQGGYYCRECGRSCVL